MNTCAHFFDPELEKLYTQNKSASNIAWTDNPSELRHLFYHLNQSGQEHNIIAKSYAFIKYKLKHVEHTYAADIIQDYTVDRLFSLQAPKIAPLPKQHWTQENVCIWVRQTSSIQLTQPHWLQNISSSISSQSLLAVQLMSLYIQLTKKDQSGVDLQQSYQSMLLATGCKPPSLHSHCFSQQAELIPDIFDFANTQLTLSRLPRLRLPEILGFTLAYCQMPGPIEVCFPKHQLPGIFFQLRQQLLQQQITHLLECISGYLDLFPQQAQALWLRIQQGFFLYHQQMKSCRDHFNDNLNTTLSPEQAVAKMLQQKAASAIGHHQKIQLQGISLDKWFTGLPENTAEFMQALILSNYIDKQCPENSLLLKLFSFKGPMFGVLDASEQDILLAWVQKGITITAPDIREIPSPLSTNVQLTTPTQIQKLSARLNNRYLYYYLVNVDLFPEALPAAKRKANVLLQACSLLSPLPFKHYSHQLFDDFIKHIYQSEISAYKPLQGQPKISKQAYIWGIEQIAPMILADGCWLQNSQSLQNLNPEIYDILFRIYCDEIGNGQLDQNHAFIFQQLLDSLSICIPPAYSSEFISHTGFIDSAFDLPVYMLTLSSFSIEFLPELLGLNMAIELSGLGKSYMRLVDDWNYWGINADIANMHISIDNYASGHTFLAKKAIQLYMDSVIQDTGDHSLQDKHWRRIYTGYASLRFVGGRFKLGLPFWYLYSIFTGKSNPANPSRHCNIYDDPYKSDQPGP